MTRAETIAMHRRMQPIAELERKAKKAGRSYSEESKDLSFRRNYEWNLKFRSEVAASQKGLPVFDRCSSCWQMGSDWCEEEKRYLSPINHTENCVLGLVPPHVYAGTMFTGAGPGPRAALPR